MRWSRLLVLALLLALAGGCSGGGAALLSGVGGVAADAGPPLSPPPPPDLRQGAAEVRLPGEPDLAASIPLQPGWNLVSFPVSRVSQVAPGPGVHPALFAWDGAAGTYVAASFTPESLHAGAGLSRGFWVLASQASQIGYEGSGLPPAPRLAPGWNLVGLPAAEAGDVEVSPATGAPERLPSAVCGEVPAPAGCLLHHQGFAFDPAGQYTAWDLGTDETSFPPGRGFWLFAHAPLDLQPPPASSATLAVSLAGAPRAATHFRFTGRDAAGLLVFGPLLRTPSVDLAVEGVPVSVVTWEIEALADGQPLALHAGPVSLGGGGTVSLPDPVFRDLATLVGLRVEPAAGEVAAGLSRDLRATALFADGSSLDATMAADWSSGAPAVAEVSSTGSTRGRVLGRSPGTASVTAALAGFQGTAAVSVSDAVLEELVLDPPAASLPPGVGVRMRVLGSFSDGVLRDVSADAGWSSGAPEVASVEPTGRVVGLRPGSASVSATVGEQTVSAEVTVTGAVLRSLSVQPAAATVPAGREQAFRAWGEFTDGHGRDVTDSVVWESSDPAVAAVSGAGVARARTAGTATLRAWRRGVQASAALTVSSAVLESLQVEPASESLPRGLGRQYAATGLFSDGSFRPVTTEVAWSTSDPSVATVSNGAADPGFVRGVGVGQAEVRASLEGRTGRATLQVTDAVPVSMQVWQTAWNNYAGLSTRFLAQVRFSDSTLRDVTQEALWTSSDPTVASVSNSFPTAGTATTHRAGDVEIRAAWGGLQEAVPLHVLEAAVVRVEVDPVAPSLPQGRQLQMQATALFSDGRAVDATDTVSWHSNSPEVTSLSNLPGEKGVLRALGAGTASLVASYPSSNVWGTANVTVTGAVLEQVEMEPSSLALRGGTAAWLRLVGRFSDGEARDLTGEAVWLSSDPQVASVAGGRVTARAEGAATVTGRVGELSAAAGVTVTGAVPTALTVEPADLSLPVGLSSEPRAMVSFSDGFVLDVTAESTWSSDAPSVASVDPGGLVRARAVGEATVTAGFAGLEAAVPVTVGAAALTSLQISPPGPSVPLGLSGDLAAHGTFTDGTVRNLTELATWSTADPTVATVSNAEGSRGRARAWKLGQTLVTVALGEVSAAAVLTVTDPVIVRLTVEAPAREMARDTVQALRAMAVYSDGTVAERTEACSWQSGNPAVASVRNAPGSRGLVTALLPGTCDLFAFDPVHGATGGLSLEVLGEPLAEIRIAPAGGLLPPGSVTAYRAEGIFADGASRDLTEQVSWTSTATAVATVSSVSGQKGRVTARAPGVATVRAVFGPTGTAGEVEIRVLEEVPALDIPGDPTLPVGFAVALKCMQGFQDVTQTVHWSSTDPAVAVVGSEGDEQGVVRGLAPGVATVRALHVASGVVAEATVTVTPATLQGLSVTPAGRLVLQGGTQAMKATGTFSDGSVLDLTEFVAWTSGSPEVASVSNRPGARGLVTGLALGPARVTAEHPQAGFSAGADVRVGGIEYAGSLELPWVTAMKASADGRLLYVLDATVQGLVLVDVPSRREIGRVATGARPGSLDVSPDGSKVLVGHAGASHVAVVSLPGLQVTRIPLPDGGRAGGVALGADGRGWAAVGPTVLRIDLEAGTVAAQTALPTFYEDLFAFAFSRALDKLFVGVEWDLMRVDLTPEAALAQKVDRRTFELAVTPDGGKLVTSFLWVYDPLDLTRKIAEVSGVSGGDDMALSPDGAWVYTASRISDYVLVSSLEDYQYHTRVLALTVPSYEQDVERVEASADGLFVFARRFHDGANPELRFFRIRR